MITSSITIYDPSTGEILHSYRSNRPDWLAAQVKPGEAYIEGDYPAHKYYIENGAPVAKGNPPGPYHVWDMASKSWVEDASLVDPSEVNAERAKRIEAGVSVTVSGHPDPVVVQGRPEDRENLNGLATAAILKQQAGDTSTNTFRDKNNVNHTLTPAQIIDLYAKATGWIEAVYTASWTIKAMDPLPTDFRDNSYWPAPSV